MWCEDPDDRMTIKEVYDELEELFGALTLSLWRMISIFMIFTFTTSFCDFNGTIIIPALYGPLNHLKNILTWFICFCYYEELIFF